MGVNTRKTYTAHYTLISTVKYLIALLSNANNCTAANLRLRQWHPEQREAVDGELKFVEVIVVRLQEDVLEPFNVRRREVGREGNDLTDQGQRADTHQPHVSCVQSIHDARVHIY